VIRTIENQAFSLFIEYFHKLGFCKIVSCEDAGAALKVNILFKIIIGSIIHSDLLIIIL